LGELKRDNFYQCIPGGLGSRKETILPVQAWRWEEQKIDNFTSASLEAGRVEKTLFYQCKLGGLGSGKETILPVRAWRLGERNRDNFNSASLAAGGEEKGHNFTSASLEAVVGEEKGNNFTSASLEVRGSGKETILPVQA
jgi:hypothetical protein